MATVVSSSQPGLLKALLQKESHKRGAGVGETHRGCTQCCSCPHAHPAHSLAATGSTIACLCSTPVNRPLLNLWAEIQQALKTKSTLLYELISAECVLSPSLTSVLFSSRQKQYQTRVVLPYCCCSHDTMNSEAYNSHGVFSFLKLQV